MAKKEEKKVVETVKKKVVKPAKEKIEKEKIVEAPKEESPEKPADTFINVIPTAEEILALTETPEYKEKLIKEETEPEQVQEIKQSNAPKLVAPLSPAAKKWRDYLRLQKQTPQDFIKKYKNTNHKFLYLIEEIIAFEEAEKKD